MSEAVECDRCGTFESRGSASLDDLSVTFAPSPGVSGGVHLCDACQKSFGLWWKRELRMHESIEEEDERKSLSEMGVEA